MNSTVTSLVYHVAVSLGAVMILAMIVRIIYSFFHLKAKLQAEIRLEEELSLLAERDDQVRSILAALDAEIAAKGVKSETYIKACDVLSQAARSLKADERIAVFEGLRPSLPYVSRIVRKTLGLAA